MQGAGWIGEGLIWHGVALAGVYLGSVFPKLRNYLSIYHMRCHQLHSCLGVSSSIAGFDRRDAGRKPKPIFGRRS